MKTLVMNNVNSEVFKIGSIDNPLDGSSVDYTNIEFDTITHKNSMCPYMEELFLIGDNRLTTGEVRLKFTNVTYLSVTGGLYVFGIYCQNSVVTFDTITMEEVKNSGGGILLSPFKPSGDHVDIEMTLSSGTFVNNLFLEGAINLHEGSKATIQSGTKFESNNIP